MREAHEALLICGGVCGGSGSCQFNRPVGGGLDHLIFPAGSGAVCGSPSEVLVIWLWWERILTGKF